MSADRVAEALRAWIGSTGRVEIRRNASEKIGGYIVHPGFAGIGVGERQSWLWRGVPNPSPLDWKGLNAVFGPEASEIGMIFAYSPAEYERFIAQETVAA